MLLLLIAAALSGPPLPFGSIFDDEALLELRRRATEEPLAAIPKERFSVDPKAAPERCHFHRLGPGARRSSELQLRFLRAPDSMRRDGFAVDAEVADESLALETSRLPLFYDARGRLIGTVTLPPPARGAQERPGTREEYIVVTYLPATQELLAEWQRQVGPHPESDLASLPQALLVQKGLVYSSYLRASAYMLCRLAPPVPSASRGPRTDGDSRTSPGPGGTRQPAP